MENGVRGLSGGATWIYASQAAADPTCSMGMSADILRKVSPNGTGTWPRDALLHSSELILVGFTVIMGALIRFVGSIDCQTTAEGRSNAGKGSVDRAPAVRRMALIRHEASQANYAGGLVHRVCPVRFKQITPPPTGHSTDRVVRLGRLSPHAVQNGRVTYHLIDHVLVCTVLRVLLGVSHLNQMVYKLPGQTRVFLQSPQFPRLP
jgi:hypothetical protein